MNIRRASPSPDENKPTNQTRLLVRREGASNGPGEALGAPEGVLVTMNYDDISYFKMEAVPQHSVYVSDEGFIVIAELGELVDDVTVVMPIWRARQVLHALQSILDELQEQCPDAGMPGDQPAK